MQKKILLAVILLTKLLFSSASYAAIRRAAAPFFSGRGSLQHQFSALGNRGYSSKEILAKDLLDAQAKKDDCLTLHNSSSESHESESHEAVQASSIKSSFGLVQHKASAIWHWVGLKLIAYKSFDYYLANLSFAREQFAKGMGINVYANISPEQVIYKSFDDYFVDQGSIYLREHLAKGMGLDLYKNISPEQVVYKSFDDYFINRKSSYAREQLAKGMGLDLYKNISPEQVIYKSFEDCLVDQKSIYLREQLAKGMGLDLYKNISPEQVVYKSFDDYFINRESSYEREELAKKLGLDLYVNISPEQVVYKSFDDYLINQRSMYEREGLAKKLGLDLYVNISPEQVVYKSFDDYLINQRSSYAREHFAKGMGINVYANILPEQFVYKSFDDCLVNKESMYEREQLAKKLGLDLYVNISPEEVVYKSVDHYLVNASSIFTRSRLAEVMKIDLYANISPQEVIYDSLQDCLEKDSASFDNIQFLARNMRINLYKNISPEEIKYKTQQEYELETSSVRYIKKNLGMELGVNIFEKIRFPYANQTEWNEEYKEADCSVSDKIEERLLGVSGQLFRHALNDRAVIKKVFANVTVIPKRFAQFADHFNRELSNDQLLPSIAQVISYKNNSFDGLKLLLSTEKSKYNDLIKPVLANEEKDRNDYLFGYHGCSDRIFLLHYLTTKVHEKKYGIKIKDQLLVRPFELATESYRDAVKRRMHLVKNGCVDDTGMGSDDRKHVISLNIGMMGSLDFRPTSPFSYATEFKDHERSIVFDPILNQYEVVMDNDKREQLANLFMTLAAERGKNKGVLYQVLINRDVADKFTYHARGAGTLVDTVVDGEKGLTVKQFMDRLCANPDINLESHTRYVANDYAYPTPHAWHYRAILTQDALFKPNGQLAPGWKLFPHFLDEEHIKSYMNQVDQIVETIKFKS